MLIKFKKLKYWRTEKTAPESGKTRVLRRRREGCSKSLLQNLERGRHGYSHGQETISTIHKSRGWTEVWSRWAVEVGGGGAANGKPLSAVQAPCGAPCKLWRHPLGCRGWGSTMAPHPGRLAPMGNVLRLP